jgi:subtilisin family serine protease
MANSRFIGFALASAMSAVLVPPSFAQVRTDSLARYINAELGVPLFVPGEVIVKFQDDALSSQMRAPIQAVRGTVAEKIHTGPMRDANQSPILVLKVSGDVMAAIRELQNDPAVEYAEPNLRYFHTAVSNDPYYTNGSLWGMYGDASPLKTNAFGSQAAEAWNAGNVGSSTVYVGVIDEGLKYNHTDLAANVWNNPFDPVDGIDNDGNGYKDDTWGWDFASNNRTVFDGPGDDHGTHVAGTIGAVGGNGVGVAGVCWNVKMISCKFLGSFGGTTTNAIKAVDYITDLKNRHGLRIVTTNNSWGGGGFSSSLQAAIERANTAGILFCAAAGNGGSDGVGDNNDTTPHYPSSYTNSNIIAVASITSTGARSSFSNYGATSVDLGAPGSGINSTLPSGSTGSTYGSYSGTSMATPHVAGACALYAATRPTATASTIRSAIIGSVIATPSLSGITVTGGRLNAGGF